MNERRGNLYLLTGLILGLVLGLAYAWVLSPVQYVDTEPASLAPEFKDEYRQVIALAYQANPNLGRARERLALLDSKDSITALAAQAQRTLGDPSSSSDEARALAALASDLSKAGEAVAAAQINQTITTTAPNQASPVIATVTLTATATIDSAQAVSTPTLPPPTVTPTITPTLAPTLTLPPSPTPKPTLSSPFKVKEKREICDRSVPSGLLQVEVIGPDEEPMPGVRVQVTWQGGESSFYTGLAPEISPGYADFKMEEGITYSLKVGEVSDTISGISAQPGCGWKITLSQSPE